MRITKISMSLGLWLSFLIVSGCMGTFASRSPSSSPINSTDGATLMHSLTPSGPIVYDGGSDILIQNVHVTSTTGDCILIYGGAKNVTIQNSEIGPCNTGSKGGKGNGIHLGTVDTVTINDNYIHPDGNGNSGCCDNSDGIYIDSNGGNSKTVSIQGNIIAYGEANIEVQKTDGLTIIGNYLLNPQNHGGRGQNIQVNGGSDINVNYNYTQAVNTSWTQKTPHQEDSINFIGVSKFQAMYNVVNGGQSASGCGMIFDVGANNGTMSNNHLLNTGECGIGVAAGTNNTVSNNEIFNQNPIKGGGNTALYVWNSYNSSCGNINVSNNIGYAINSNGNPNSYWDGGGCDPVTSTNNTFDGAAESILSARSGDFILPIPPEPATCVIASPYTNNTSKNSCSAGGGTASAKVEIIALHANNNVVVDETSWSTKNGTLMQVWTSSGGSNQRWNMVPISGSFGNAFQIESAYSGKCLDVKGYPTDASRADGAQIEQWDCIGAGQLNQIWQLKSVGNSYEIISVNSGKCLDLTNGNQNNETIPQQWTCGGDQNQLWDLISK